MDVNRLTLDGLVSTHLLKIKSYSGVSYNIPMKQKMASMRFITFCQKNNSMSFSGEIILEKNGN